MMHTKIQAINGTHKADEFIERLEMHLFATTPLFRSFKIFSTTINLCLCLHTFLDNIF